MAPWLIDNAQLAIQTHTVFLAAAVVVASFLVARESRVRDLGFQISARDGVWVFLGALFGARLFWTFEFEGWTQLWRALLIWEGGFAFYGGLVGASVAAAVYCRVVGIPTLKAFDLGAAYMPLVEAIARVGCFLAGCCFGTTCALPWALRFPPGSAVYIHQYRNGLIEPSAAATLSVHPVQIYMSVALILLFIVLRRLWLHDHYDGAICVAYGVVYALFRFAVEFLRADSTRPLAGLTVPQVFSVVMLLLSLVAGIRLRRNYREENVNG